MTKNKVKILLFISIMLPFMFGLFTVKRIPILFENAPVHYMYGYVMGTLSLGVPLIAIIDIIRDELNE